MVWKKNALLLKRKLKKWGKVHRQVIEEDVVQVGALRGQGGANGAC